MSTVTHHVEIKIENCINVYTMGHATKTGIIVLDRDTFFNFNFYTMGHVTETGINGFRDTIFNFNFYTIGHVTETGISGSRDTIFNFSGCSLRHLQHDWLVGTEIVHYIYVFFIRHHGFTNQPIMYIMT